MLEKYNIYDTIILTENLYEAWGEFVRDKKHKNDVEEFSLFLSQYIIELHTELKNKTYRHGPYQAFAINDPKPRSIHKATVRDRLLHHAVYRVLYAHVNRKFIHDSYSCRYGKGTHRAGKRFVEFSQKVSRNYRQTCWVLKCDIRKFFASINHEVLMSVVAKHIEDSNVLWLLQNIVGSFYSTAPGVGLPLGNLTSQLLVNVYMNEFDQWVKHELKVHTYIRYADDFVLLHANRDVLEGWLIEISAFLETKLLLSLHPDKVYIKTFASSVDFLGWIHFPAHRVLRTSTKRRMFKKLEASEYHNATVNVTINEKTTLFFSGRALAGQGNSQVAGGVGMSVKF